MAYDLLSGKQTARDWSCGSVLFPKDMSNKVDDLRYDLRDTTRTLRAGMFALAGSFTILSLASIYRTSQR